MKKLYWLGLVLSLGLYAVGCSPADGGGDTTPAVDTSGGMNEAPAGEPTTDTPSSEPAASTPATEPSATPPAAEPPATTPPAGDAPAATPPATTPAPPKPE